MYWSVGQDFVIIRITCARVELVDFAHGIHPYDPYGLAPAVAVRHEAWELEPAERRELPDKSFIHGNDRVSQLAGRPDIVLHVHAGTRPVDRRDTCRASAKRVHPLPTRSDAP